MSATQELGDLVLLIGDFHIPYRASALPKCFSELLDTDKISHVLCTGNVGSQTTLDLLHKVSRNVYIVKGDKDYQFDFPEEAVVQIGEFKIGLIHGHQVVPHNDEQCLLSTQRYLNCDVLVSGHTHCNNAEMIGDKVLINPGSATGAFTPSLNSMPNPSFMLMAVQGSAMILYIYEERGGKACVEMSEFVKKSKSGG